MLNENIWCKVKDDLLKKFIWIAQMNIENTDGDFSWLRY